MRIDFSSINRNDFRVMPRETVAGRMVLILPTFEKHIWKDDETHLRSLLCSEDGTVVSMGFEKFRNLYETQRETDELTSSFNSGNLVLTEKLDGSLILRSIVNGHVLFRTRGSHEIEPEMRSELMDFIQKYHSRLLNPKLYPKGTLLFEWCSPNNMIVLLQKEPKLTLLGLNHHNPELNDSVLYLDNELEYIAKDLRVPQVNYWKPTESTLDEMIQNISQDQNREGCVAVCYRNDKVNPYLVKLKTKWYLELHRAAYSGSTQSRDLIAKFAARSPQELMEKMLTVGGMDFEIASIITEKCRPIFEETAKDYQRLMESSEELSIKLAGILDRKTVAITIKDYLSSKNLPGGWLGMLLAKHFKKENDWDLAQRSVLSGLSTTYIKQNVLNT